MNQRSWGSWWARAIALLGLVGWASALEAQQARFSPWTNPGRAGSVADRPPSTAADAADRVAAPPSTSTLPVGPAAVSPASGSAVAHPVGLLPASAVSASVPAVVPVPHAGPSPPSVPLNLASPMPTATLTQPPTADLPAERLPEPRALQAGSDSGSAKPAAGGPAAAGLTPTDAGAANSPAIPIDLSTTLQLVDAQSPTIGLAQARLRQALAQVDRASVLWLPSFAAGVTYFRHDGIDQNRRGDTFTISRSNVFLGPAVLLRVDLAQAYFEPIIRRQLATAATADTRTVRNQTQFEATSAYLDLQAAYAALAINADTLTRAEQMLERAKAADQTGLIKTKADVNRAQTEVSLRKQERFELQARVGVASARLIRVLNLQQTIDLVPTDPAVVPLTLVPKEQSLDGLVQLALANRPEVESVRALLLASQQRLRQAQLDPLLPSVQLDFRGGGFSGKGRTPASSFDGQAEGLLGVTWDVQNLGLGNVAMVRERRAELDQTYFRAQELAAQIRAEVVEAARIAAAREAALSDAQRAVLEAQTMYRKLLDTSFGMIAPRPQYDALEPLLAIQALNQARLQYLAQVIEYNRAQFRLYTALGQPPSQGLGSAVAQPLPVPVTPPVAGQSK